MTVELVDGVIKLCDESNENINLVLKGMSENITDQS